MKKGIDASLVAVVAVLAGLTLLRDPARGCGCKNVGEHLVRQGLKMLVGL